MQNLPYIFLALMAGAALPLHAAVNAALGRTLASPPWAAAMSFIVGSAALLAYIALTRTTVPATGLKDIPAWMWIGGILGAFYVIASIMAVPVTGAALFLSCIVAGQMLSSLLFDHWGVAGLAVHPLNLPRTAGAILIACGVVLIRKF